MTIGIYSLYWEDQDLIYIGQSVNIERRWKEHIRDLSRRIHTNYKVQNTYNLYGLPIMNIIEETELEFLNTKEISWTKEFDSLNSKHGLNIVEAGISGWGTNSNNSKYSRIKILRIFSRLYSSSLSQDKIAIIEKVPRWVVKDIKMGAAHIWIQKLWPEKYTTMFNRSDVRTTEVTDEYFELVSPLGDTYCVNNIREFCKLHPLLSDNITSSSLNIRRLRRKERASYRGWKLHNGSII